MEIFTRRSFSFSFVAVALTSWLNKPSQAAFGHSADMWAAANQCLLSLFRDIDAPRALGDRYLAIYPADTNRRTLGADVFGTAKTVDPQSMRTHLARRVSQDFTDGNTVIVDGWVLARSEARACAMVALHAKCRK
jgi:hypothetical protein